MPIVNASIQHLTDTASNFASANPELLAGQIGIESDDLLTTPKFKIGDGITDWATLPYFSSGEAFDNVLRQEVKLSTAISKGQAVYISSANGTNIIVSKASNATEATSSKTLGLLETGGATNAIVNVITDGLLAGLNTSTATIGDPVWLGVNGDLIYGLASKPVAPAHLVYIGVVSRVSATVGEILIKVQNGFELNEIHDVNPSLSVTVPVDADSLLIKENSSGLWKALSWANLKGNLSDVREEYYYLKPMTLEAAYPKMDGVGIYSRNGVLATTGGWNPNSEPGYTPNTQRSWESYDNGLTFTRVSDSPFAGRHTHFCLNINNDIYVGGGSNDSSTGHTDMWKLDSTDTWTQVVSNWTSTINSRIGITACEHNGDILVAGGQSGVAGASFNDVYKITTTGTISYFCALPAALVAFSFGQIFSYKGEIYLVGGGYYNNGVIINLNTKCYKTSNNGATWTDLGAVPTTMVGVFPNGVVWDDKMWLLSGSTNVNLKGLHYSNDGVTWTELYESAPARHASGLCVHNGGLNIVAGNFWRDSWRIQKENVLKTNYVSPLISTLYNTLEEKYSTNLLKSINKLVDGLQADGLITDIYLLGVTAGLETNEQRLRPLFSNGSKKYFTNIGAITHSVDGVNGGGVGVLNLNWNMVNHGDAGVGNSIAMGVCVKENYGADVAEMGVFTGSNQFGLIAKGSDNRTYYSVNDGSNYAYYGVGTGFFFAKRTSSTSRQIKNNNEYLISTQASLGAQSANVYGCAGNVNGVGGYKSSKTQQLFFLGKGAIDMAKLEYRIKLFFKERGINY